MKELKNVPFHPPREASVATSQQNSTTVTNVSGHTIRSGNQCTMTSAFWFTYGKTATVSITEWCGQWVWWDTRPSSCGAFYTIGVCACVDFTRMWMCECPSVGRSVMISSAVSGWLMLVLAALLLLGLETRSHAPVRCARQKFGQTEWRGKTLLGALWPFTSFWCLSLLVSRSFNNSRLWVNDTAFVHYFFINLSLSLHKSWQLMIHLLNRGLWNVFICPC